MKMATKHTSPVNIEARKGADVRPGDTVRVWQKIQEGDKTRLQAFEGLVIARKHGKEAGATFTVRKVTSGVGVEKIFTLYSPLIDRVEVVKRSKVRRAKLYYIREKASREIKKKMKQLRFAAQEVISQGGAPEEEEQPKEADAVAENEVPTPETPQESVEEKKEEGENKEASSANEEDKKE